MYILDDTLPTPAENLACDELLLTLADEGSLPGELLRMWIPQSPFVVLGYTRSVRDDVHEDFCHDAGIPVHRRCTGGGTVLQLPGCLNYALILRVNAALHSISDSNAAIMSRIRDALRPVLQQQVEIRGESDLAIREMKIAGSAQRRGTGYLLFHGSLLLNANLALVERALRLPTRQPDYRNHRSHGTFLTNIGTDCETVKQALTGEWHAFDNPPPIDRKRLALLVQQRYEQTSWIYRIP